MPARPASNCSVCSFERGYTWTATRCHTHNRFSQSAKLFVTVASGEGEREKKEKKNAWRHSIYLNSNTFLLTPFHKYHVYLHIKQTPVKKKSAEWLPITAFHHDFFLLLFFYGHLHSGSFEAYIQLISDAGKCNRNSVSFPPPPHTISVFCIYLFVSNIRYVLRECPTTSKVSNCVHCLHDVYVCNITSGTPFFLLYYCVHAVRQ